MLGRMLRIAAWAVTAGLWALQGWECVRRPSWLTPDLDRLCDSAMVVLTLTLTGWYLLEHYTRPHAERQHLHDRQVGALVDFTAALGRRAGVEAPDAQPTQPLPALRVVGRRQGTG